MARVRIFKVKTFARWAKGIITDAQLCSAAREILQGRYEADLGAGLCKKRIAKAGHGKSGSVRTLVAKQGTHGLFFVVGREKSDPGADFSAANLSAAKLIGAALQAASIKELEALVSAGTLKEIQDEYGQ